MFLTCDQIRNLEHRAIHDLGIPALILMENAGRGAAQTLINLGIHGPVAVCCGKGNNGGDGLVLARHLDIAGVPVHVHLFARPEELTSEAAVNHHIVHAAGIPMRSWDLKQFQEHDLAEALTDADWVVDALFGIGLKGPVRPPFDRIIAGINAGPAKVFAVDVPSGLDADTGQPRGATIRARHTATFLAAKAGFAQPAAREWTGQVHIIDIGVPPRLFG